MLSHFMNISQFILFTVGRYLDSFRFVAVVAGAMNSFVLVFVSVVHIHKIGISDQKVCRCLGLPDTAGFPKLLYWFTFPPTVFYILGHT